MSTASERARMPSIRDVARLAGVSHQTVSRVLNDHPSIRPETKAKKCCMGCWPMLYSK